MKTPLNAKALNAPSGTLAVTGAVAMAMPTSACIAATPSIARAMIGAVAVAVALVLVRGERKDAAELAPEGTARA